MSVDKSKMPLSYVKKMEENASIMAGYSSAHAPPALHTS